MYFRSATENDFIESIMLLNKEGSIYDISRTSGVCPNVFKLAQITPRQKKGSLHNISNYRLVSVLSNFSKVFENLIYNRLQSFRQTSNFLEKNQFGFR